MDSKKLASVMRVAIIGTFLAAIILVAGTFWNGRSASADTEKAVRSVSLLYLNELAERREQVVAARLANYISDMGIAVGLIEKEDLNSIERLQKYQARMKQLYGLEKFAFVDTTGLIYTSRGTRTDIELYNIDYNHLTKPEISIKNVDAENKTVIIAIPVDRLPLENRILVVCFMEISVPSLIDGLSLQGEKNNATFCNIYTQDGNSLTNMVLGGLASEDNLLNAVQRANYDTGYSFEKVKEDFAQHKEGVVSFTYNNIRETLYYVPVHNTDWMLTYLIRESIISEQIESISSGIIFRGQCLSGLTALVLVGMFAFVIVQIRRNTRIRLEHEIQEAKDRIKQESLSEALKVAEESNKAKTIFLSNMSHEIRTPMNAIIGLDNLALHEPDISDKVRDYLTKIGGSAEHLLKLINEILDMSRIEAGRFTLKKEEFSFSKLMEQVNTMFSVQCEEKGLRYNCHLAGQIDEYFIGDDMKLRQVLINILGNSVKFTNKGGRIDLSVEKIASFERNSTLRFVISDTGIGMSKEFLPKIFDSFAQENTGNSSKYDGSGLGLAISKSIVELMNGNIEVESEKGRGTTFTITVTLQDSHRSHSSDGDINVRLNELHVLVVDDDPVALEHARLVLELAGITTETAKSGKEAVEMVKLRHGRREPFNLIIIDWKMPEMDGVETTRQIRATTGDESAIIILTAYNWDDVLDEAIRAGVDSFVAKPIFTGALLDEFKKVLKKKQNALLGSPKKAELRGKRILLAEDVDVNAQIMENVLAMREIQTDIATNGKIALEKFSEHPAGYYDAILMDIRMPEMDGLEATAAIRKLDRDDAQKIPIIALTANAFDEDVQRSLQAGMNAHLSKPIQPEALFETLETILS